MAEGDMQQSLEIDKVSDEDSDEDSLSEWQEITESKTDEDLEFVLQNEGTISLPSGYREAAKRELERRRKEEERLETLRNDNPEEYKLEMPKKRKETKKGRQARQGQATRGKDIYSRMLAEKQQGQHQYEEERARLEQELKSNITDVRRREVEERLQKVEGEIQRAKKMQEIWQRDVNKQEEYLRKVAEEQDEESQRFLKEAIKQGYVIARIVKCIIEGPAGVGKTCLKLLLLSKKPPTCRTSTGCIDPIRAVSGARIQTLEDDGWHELTEDDLAVLVADAIPLLCDQIACEQELPSKVLEALRQLLDESDEASTDAQEGPEATPPDGPHLEATSTDSPQPDATPSTKDDSPDTQDQAASYASTPARQATSAILKKIIDRISSGKEAGRFLRPKLIHFIDSGGQPPFRELIRIFSKHTSVAVLVFRLSEELAAHPTVEYYDETGRLVGTPHPSPLTNEEMLKVMTRSLQTSPIDGKPPKVIIVGTHKDKEDECPNETREEKNKKLYNILHPIMPSQLLFYGEAFDELIFPMNTKEPGEEEKKIAAILREEIEKCSREVRIPIWWYILELILRQLAKSTDRRVLSRHECLEVARTLGFSEKAFDAAINYLHDLNIILYYPRILPNAIFMDCQVILDKLSELIKRSYELREAKQGRQSSESPKAIAGNRERFRDLGIIALEFLEEYPELYVDGLFTPTDLVKLLGELLVLAPISRDEYFMPCLLEMLSPAELDKRRVLHATASPLLLRFPNGWPRDGVYCCLVVFLLNQCKWKVVHPNGAPILISRNCIKFQLPNAPCVVTLIDSFSHFELHVSASTPRQVCYNICPSIKDMVLAGIDAASDNLHYNNAKPTVAMFCPHSSDNTPVQPSATPHAAIVKGYPWWVCSENVDLCGELCDQQKVWFSPAEKLSMEGIHMKGGSQKTLDPFVVTTIPKGVQQTGGSQKTSESSPVATIRKEDKPSLLVLRKFPGKDRKFNVMERIGVNYFDFGMFLLQDDDGSIISALELTWQRAPLPICRDIMTAWLQGKGKTPVTYATLLNCLHEADLPNLAKDIEDVLTIS